MGRGDKKGPLNRYGTGPLTIHSRVERAKGRCSTKLHLGSRQFASFALLEWACASLSLARSKPIYGAW